MKRILFFLSAATMIVSCNLEIINPNEDEGTTQEISETGDVSSITECSAIVSAVFNPIDGKTRPSCGVLFSKDENPSLNNGTPLIARGVSEDNSYYIEITELSSNTTYYYRSFVKNGDTYHYGKVKSFKTLEITASINTSITETTEDSASVSVFLTTSTKADLEKSVAVYYGESGITESDLVSKGKEVRCSINEDGSYKAIVNNLEYGKSYSLISVVTIYDAVFHGELTHFSTQDIEVSVNALAANNISEHKATLNGQLTVSIEKTVFKKVWFIYSDSLNSVEDLITRGITVDSKITDENTFSSEITNLDINTEYFFMAVAQVNGEKYYSEVQSFSTKDIDVCFTILDPSGVSEFKATLNANVVVNSSETIYPSVDFLYSASENTLEGLIARGVRIHSYMDGSGFFKVSLEKLSFGAIYHYVVVASVQDKLYYSEISTFKTNDIVPAFSNFTTVETTDYSAELSCSISVDTIDEVSFDGVLFYSDTNNTVEGLISNGTRVSLYYGNDLFHATINNLSYNTTYYYTIVAIIAGQFKIPYNGIESFKTNAIETHTEIPDVFYTGATLKGSSVFTKWKWSSEVWFLISEYASSLDVMITEGKKIDSSLNNDGSFSSTVKGLKENTTYNYIAAAKVNEEFFYGEISSFTTRNVSTPGAVALSCFLTRKDGTQYEILWADHNVGADSPEKEGALYAWGEVSSKTEFTWYNYKWGTWGSSGYGGEKYYVTKYCQQPSYYWGGVGEADNIFVLLPEDDVASIKWGGAWRMPTDEETDALMNQCCWTSTTVNGKNGFFVTSEAEGNANSIFIPAVGGYWSSTVEHGLSAYDQCTNARGFVISSEGPAGCCSIRSDGFSVRPVIE